jgi:transposase
LVIKATIAAGIEDITMDMGLIYQKSVRDSLPNVDIVFDRFHVMKNYSDVIKY